MKYLLLLLVLFSCKHDVNLIAANDGISKAPYCIALEVPAKARQNYPFIQSSWNGYSKIVSKCYVVDSAAWATLFNHSDSIAILYVRNLSTIVSVIQIKDSIRTTCSLIKIMHNDYGIKGDIQRFGTYTHDSLAGKADIFTLLSFSFRGGGLGWIGGLCTGNLYNTCVCGISGGVAKLSIDSLVKNIPYHFDIEVTAHEQGHVMGNLQHTHNCVWNGNKTKQDMCGDHANYVECADGEDIPDPIGGGTIESYCHLRPVGINLNLGYGAQCRDSMRSYISSVGCLIKP